MKLKCLFSFNQTLVNGLNDMILDGDEKLKKVNQVAVSLSKCLQAKTARNTWGFFYAFLNISNLMILVIVVMTTDFILYNNRTFMYYGINVRNQISLIFMFLNLISLR